MLPICLGEATKFAQGLTDADKTYEALVELGVTTTTGDAEGEVTGRHEVAVGPEAVEAALAGFRGPILQVPPMHSALKRQGQPLYAYARRGEEVARAPRPVTIHELRLLEASGTRLRLLVRCSKGTYVRVLAEDIGRGLGCGAHLAGLRRTAVGVFAVAQAHPLDEVEALNHEQRAGLLLPVDALLEGLPSLQLDAAGAAAFRHGRAVRAPSGSSAGLLRAYGPAGEFLGVGCHDPRSGSGPAGRHLEEEVAGELASQAEQKNLHLTVEIQDQLPAGNGSPRLFRSLWENLLGNAIKYTLPGGTVTASLRLENDQVVGQVRDTGIGIPLEEQGRLFSEFFRARNAKALGLRGTGLGLVIVKRIVDGAGGSLQVESQEGQGSTITFNLPSVAKPELQGAGEK